MAFQVHFLRTGVWTERSDLFETFHDAEAYAAERAEWREPKPEVVAIVEVDDGGNAGRVHKIQVF